MEDEQIIKDKPSNNILAQITHRYMPFWPVFVIFTTISLFIAFLYLRSQTKIYVASAKVLLKDPQKGSGDSKVLDALNIFSEKKIVENEIIVLQSSSLMEEVVKSLDLYATVYNEGKVQKEELYAENSPVSFIATNKDSIKAAGRYFFEIDWKKEVVKIAGQIIPFNGFIKLNNTEYRIKINPEYNRNVVGKNYYAIFNSLHSAAAPLFSAMKVAPISYSSTVIGVSMETPIPKKGVDILNRLFEVYNTAGIEDKNQIASKTLAFIEDRLNTVISQLDSVEHNIESYKSRNEVSDLGNQAVIYFNTVKELDKSNSALELQLQLLDDVLNYVNVKGKKQGIVPSLVLLNDETLKSLLSQLYTAEFDLDKARTTAGTKSDIVLLAEGKVDQIKEDIKENISNIRNSFVAQKQSNQAGINLNKSFYSSVL